MWRVFYGDARIGPHNGTQRMYLQIRNLTFKYPNAPNDVFRDLSFALEHPGFHALFGPSGVGKTSLARIITGDIFDFSGQIRTEGMDIRLYSYNLERLPGWSGVHRHLEKVTPPRRHERRQGLIAAFGLTECIGQRFSQLSLGQQNRVNLLRYLLQDFNLLIMDESLANVDEFTREKILLHIKAMFPEAYFLYISHNVIEVSKFCRKIVVMRDGGKTPPASIVRGQDLQSGGEIDNAKLQRTMLEIMNASA
jgi:ABC-type multidrug transport system ATPase subunit